MADLVRPPWMTDQMYQEWYTYYLDAGGSGVQGSENAATETFRASATYEGYFPGIKREDGAIRYSNDPEQTYFSNLSAYQNIVGGLKMNPDTFAEEYIDLIRGDTSPSEFATRATALQQRVISQGPAIRDWYAENYAMDLTPEGILASLMSTRIDEAILSRQITMSEIAGEGESRGFDISSEFANMLATDGKMNRDEAMQMFGSAERVLPILNALAMRHGDVDDDFDIYEFADAQALGDPTQSARLNRLEAQEESLFTGGAQLDYAKNRAGGVSGLADL